MAALRSLGISKPAGLSYLIAEGALQPNSADYIWSCDGDPGDELLVAGSQVVWTRYGAIHRVYTFQVEHENVVQALFAKFPKESKTLDSGLQTTKDRKAFESAVEPGLLKDSSDRAVVVLLESHAHIYPIGGSAQVVNLPFEVQRAFPTPYGLILQRAQVVRSITISFQTTKTPANSFAVPRPNSQASPESWKTRLGLIEPDPFYKALWRSDTVPKGQASHRELPHHVYIRNPLTEVGIVGSVIETERKPGKPPSFVQYKRLPSEEEILYISSESELANVEVLLAVSWNHALNQCTIWKIAETRERVSLRKQNKIENYLESRRRSSHGPGTGTTTPGVRASINPRESIGGYNENRTTLKSRKPKNDVELASQLDAAFESTTAAAQSSRRISSLLARSDLATGNDAGGITDPMQVSNKRGTSFGGPAMRTSFGGPASSFGRKSGRVSYLGNDLQDVPSGDVSDDSMHTESDSDTSAPSLAASRSLQRELAFVKIESFSIPRDTKVAMKNNESWQPSTTVMQTPSHQERDGVFTVTVYIHEPSSKKVFCKNLHIKTSMNSSGCTYAEINTRRSSEILNYVNGVCKIGKFANAQCIMLGSDESGTNSLLLHSPNNDGIPLHIPTILLRRNPYQVNTIDFLQRKREGSFKRVLSEGVDRVCGIRQSATINQFDIADSRDTWHRLEFECGPGYGFIQKLLDICQFVLLGDINEHKSVHRLYNDISLWLSHSGQMTDSHEWKTFMITLFTFFIIHLPKATKAAPRSRRKAGLLRSSSGAQIDTESFDTMMLVEDRFGSASPSWLQGMAWKWATEPLSPAASSKEQRSPMFKKMTIIPDVLQLTRDFIATDVGQSVYGKDGYLRMDQSTTKKSHAALTWLLAALHLVREEEKLNTLAASDVQALAPVLAQMGGWLGCVEWDWRESSFYNTESPELDRWIFDEAVIEPLQSPRPQIPPPSLFAHIEAILLGQSSKTYPSLSELPPFEQPWIGPNLVATLTPRTGMTLKILEMRNLDPTKTLAEYCAANWGQNVLETLPEGIVSSLQSALVICKAQPHSTAGKSTLELLGREDLAMLQDATNVGRPQGRGNDNTKHEAIRDYHHAANVSFPDSEDVGPYDEAAEMDRQSITRLIFSTDQRFSEAARLVHPLKPSIAQCIPEPEWTDQELLEAQQELAKVIAFRTLSVSPGRAMLFYNARQPLLTEKFPIHGFTLSTVMKPSNITVAADRAAYTEEKVSWAFFHAGVEAGLTISKGAKGIDTSWILFNKPKELGDRHAGFLLALGLNGHLKKIAKWVAFKYLTPKHTMTSIGLLLGLAASHIGTMDALITRLLSVHVTRMLPVGAAELNLSPLTQTTGLMALGLLYHNTQHRRMTEIMLSEIESCEQDDGINPMEDLRDEGYRLAAGFALGFINLGQGRKTKGLNDMRIVERLLSLVTATRKISLVHILDKATAGATIAIALIFLKTEDKALAKKIDIPDTVHQFEYVRPDIFLLRTLARHLIMWNEIQPTTTWIEQSLPSAFNKRFDLGDVRALHTEDLPLYNVLAGLCLVIGLRYAGSARTDVRDLLLVYLDHFIRVNKLPALHYDGRLTRITTRNCQDVVGLAAAAVMAGTGDLQLFRRYRSLHGRTTPDTPYGSHLAAHQAIGLLFLGGGTHSLGTSNLAVASLLCSFYPLFPSDVQDNKAHLQVFRHFWVLAADPRCLTPRSARTFRPMSIKVLVKLKSGEQSRLEAPCILPELHTISKIVSTDPRYWEVVLDFEDNVNHLNAFKQHQSLFVRKRGAYDSHSSTFSATMQTLNDRQVFQQIRKQVFEWIFTLPSLAFLDQAKRAMLLPSDTESLPSIVGRTTVIDDRLTLEKESLLSAKIERLWSLRVLFAWAEHISRTGGDLAWLGQGVIRSLQARIALMSNE